MKLVRRVLRGGSYFYDPDSLHCTDRSWDSPEFRCRYFGFRLVVRRKS